jgi:hypothetical protein
MRDDLLRAAGPYSQPLWRLNNLSCELLLTNNSSIRVGVSLRSGTLQYLLYARNDVAGSCTSLSSSYARSPCDDAIQQPCRMG